MCRYNPYITKALRKAIMNRSELETNENLKCYKSRGICAVNYMKKTMTDNKEFWKTVKSFLFEKVATFPRI